MRAPLDYVRDYLNQNPVPSIISLTAMVRQVKEDAYKDGVEHGMGSFLEIASDTATRTRRMQSAQVYADDPCDTVIYNLGRQA
jgi:hypothetical protein